MIHKLKVYASVALILPILAVIDFVAGFTIRVRYDGNFRTSFRSSRKRLYAAARRELEVTK